MNPVTLLLKYDPDSLNIVLLRLAAHLSWLQAKGGRVVNTLFTVKDPETKGESFWVRPKSGTPYLLDDILDDIETRHILVAPTGNNIDVLHKWLRARGDQRSADKLQVMYPELIPQQLSGIQGVMRSWLNQ